jgi:hypothetical protein
VEREIRSRCRRRHPAGHGAHLAQEWNGLCVGSCCKDDDEVELNLLDVFPRRKNEEQLKIGS